MKNKEGMLILVDPFTGGDEFITSALSLGLSVVAISCLYDLDNLKEKFKGSAVEFVVVKNKNVSDWMQDLPPKGRVLGILPGGDLSMVRAAELSNLYGLPFFVTPEVGQQCVYKDLMRYAVESAGVEQPAFAVFDLNGVESLSGKLDDVAIKFPCIVKPTDLGGSLNVKRVGDMEDLKEALNTIKKFNLFDHIKSNSYNSFDRRSTAMIEEEAIGPEFSVDGILDEGKFLFSVVTEKATTGAPHFIETGHIVPTINFVEHETELVSYAKTISKALGIEKGPIHCEVKLTDKGPRLIECAARLGGDKIPYLIKKSTGVDLYQSTIELAIGIKPKIDRKYSKYSGIHFIMGQSYTEKLAKQYHDLMREFPQIQDLYFKEEGNGSLTPRSNVFDRIGHVLFMSESENELIAVLKGCERQKRLVPNES
ncbi:ATP-grasp domain-containing protein [Saccharospirillum salsuginis]|uniref:ATP-grasp domain-containing protein n=1 Tax=Saccharospirillum salsuginis TaxID=418750 RepID=A0A918KCC4_9GAMM|nr:ATP-grasp domain-containing protein [Saccharospirillum salsuginis]GGX57336.1 hypothetical protein GCM10007392_26120 [Saccharospirillum salsuginis]